MRYFDQRSSKRRWGCLALSGDAQHPEQIQLPSSATTAAVHDAIDRSGLELCHQYVQVFTTDDLGDGEVAEDVRSRDYEWLEPPVCGGAPRLSGVFMGDRSGEWIISLLNSEPAVHFWLPQAPPVGLAMYGHGINNRAESGDSFAALVNPLGVAVVAVDAMHHGQHPTADPDSAMPALNFLGVNLSQLAFDTQNLRGSFDKPWPMAQRFSCSSSIRIDGMKRRMLSSQP